jgi:hypothetical protein
VGISTRALVTCRARGRVGFMRWSFAQGGSMASSLWGVRDGGGGWGGVQRRGGGCESWAEQLMRIWWWRKGAEGVSQSRVNQGK